MAGRKKTPGPGFHRVGSWRGQRRRGKCRRRDRGSTGRGRKPPRVSHRVYRGRRIGGGRGRLSSQSEFRRLDTVLREQEAESVMPYFQLAFAVNEQRPPSVQFRPVSAGLPGVTAAHTASRIGRTKPRTGGDIPRRRTCHHLLHSMTRNRLKAYGAAAAGLLARFFGSSQPSPDRQVVAFQKRRKTSDQSPEKR